MAGRVNTKFVFLLAGILVVMVLGFAGFYYLKVYHTPEELIHQGDLFASQNQYAMAVQSYGKALHKRPGDVDLLEKYVATLRHVEVDQVQNAKQNVSQMVSFTKRASDLRPDDEQRRAAYFDLLLHLTRKGLGSYSQIYSEASTRLQTQADDVVAHMYRGIARVHMLTSDMPLADQQQARDDLALALKKMPGNIEVAYHLARWDLFRADALDQPAGKPAEAVKLRAAALNLAQKQLAAQPGDAQATVRTMYRVRVLLALKKKAQAMPLLDQLEKQLLSDPRPQRAVVTVASLLAATSEDANAARPGTQPDTSRMHRLVRAAAKAYPDDIRYRAILAQLQARQGKVDSAIADYEQARKMTRKAASVAFLVGQQESRNATLALANLRLSKATTADDAKARDEQLNQVDDLLAQIKKWAGSTSGPVALLEGRVALLRRDNAKAAVKLDQAAAAYHNRNLQALLLAAATHKQQGDWGTAATQFKTALALQPHQPKVRLQLAEIYLRAGQTDNAAGQLDALLKAEPNNFAAQALHAQLLAQQGHSDEALAAFKKLDPAKHPQLVSPMVRLELTMGHRDEAIALLQRAFEANPKDVGVLQLLVELTKEKGARQAIFAKAKAAGVNAAVLDLLEQKATGSAKENQDELIAQLLDQQQDPFQRALLKARIERQRNHPKEAKAALAAAAKLKPDNPQVVDMQFDFALADKDFDQAQQLADRATDLNLDQAQGAFYQGRLDMVRGQVDTAVVHFQQGVQARPVYSQGWVLLGQAQAVHQNLPDALLAFQKALEQRPNNLDALAGLRQVQDAQGDHRAALRTLRTAVKYAPNNRRLIRQYLAHEQAYGDADRAIEDRQKFAKADPGDVANREALALLLVRQGQKDEALKEAKALVKSHGKTLDTVATLADVHRLAGQTKAGEKLLADYVIAREQAKQVTARDYTTLAHYRLAVGDNDGALSAYHEAIKYEDPKKHEVSRELGDLLFNRGAYHAAATVYTQLHKGDPRDAKLTVRLADTLIRDKKFDEAAKLLEPMPASAQVNALEGMLALHRGDKGKAMTLFNDAIRLEPNNAMLYLERARLLAQDVRKRPQALDDLNTALNLQPRLAAARSLYADLNLALGNVSDAIGALRTLIRDNPADSTSRVRLAQAYVSQHDSNSARVVLEAGRKLDPKDGRWPALLAGLADHDGRVAEALDLWRQAVALNPKAANYLMAYGQALLEAGQPDKVLVLARDHATVMNAVAALEALRGKALARTKRMDEAQRVFADALAKCKHLGELNQVSTLMTQSLGPDKAIAQLRSDKLKLSPLWRSLAVVQIDMRAGRWTQARDGLVQARKRLPKDDAQVESIYQGLLGNTLYSLHQYEGAKQAYEAQLKAQPGNVDTLNNLAYLLANDLKDASAALPLARKAAALRPGNAQILDTLGWTLYKAGKHDDARTTLQRSIALQPLAPACMHLGAVYMDLGSANRARDLLNQAVQLAQQTKDHDVLAGAKALLKRLGPPRAEANAR